MMLILFASLVGAVQTAIILWDHGALTALLAAPFGGSAFGGLVALIVSYRMLLGFEDVEPEPAPGEAAPVKVLAASRVEQVKDQQAA
jgi:hypothetical protein